MKHLTDKELLRQTKSLVQQERELLTQVLDHLREISDRKLFAELGYKSLLEFAVKHLGYSESQGYRRIAAMKLVREVPGLEEKIQKGEVHLNHIGLAQNLFRQEAKEATPFSAQQKMEVLNKMVGTSTREAEKITIQMSSKPESLRPEKAKAISDTAVSLQVTISSETLVQIETLKGWLAHRFPDMKTGKLIEKLCELGLKEWSPSKPVAVRPKKAAQIRNGEPAKFYSQINETCDLNWQPSTRSETQSNSSKSGLSSTAVGARALFAEDNSSSKSEVSKASEMKAKIDTTNRAKISATVRRQIFEKAENRCEKCQSSFRLEVDHRFPVALGGGNDPENLRVLCFNCNQRSAINAFGKEKIISKVGESLGRVF